MAVNFTNTTKTAETTNPNPSPSPGLEKPEVNTEEKEKISVVDKINNYLLKFSRVPLKERLFFVQHLGIMLKAGISLSVAINTLAEQTRNKYFIKILGDIGSKVNKGISLADSLRDYSKIFGELFISMVEAGELSGKLEEVLAELYLQMKKEHAIISKVKGALTYPTVIMFAMLGIGTFMFMVIIPKMTAVFTEMSVELPLPTKVLISVSNAMAQNGVLTVLIMAITAAIIYKLLKTEKGKYYFQALLLVVPPFSGIIKKINLARFARNISSLLKTDIMIIKSFNITGKVLGNLHYRKALFDIADRLKKGGNINESIKLYPKLFPPIVTQMIAIGEETGELDTILIELAEFYEEEVNQIMDNLPSIIEPILILVLGVGVGGIAVAIIMPMYSITQSI